MGQTKSNRLQNQAIRYARCSTQPLSRHRVYRCSGKRQSHEVQKNRCGHKVTTNIGHCQNLGMRRCRHGCHGEVGHSLPDSGGAARSIGSGQNLETVACIRVLQYAHWLRPKSRSSCCRHTCMWGMCASLSLVRLGQLVTQYSRHDNTVDLIFVLGSACQVLQCAHRFSSLALLHS